MPPLSLQKLDASARANLMSLLLATVLFALVVPGPGLVIGRTGFFSILGVPFTALTAMLSVLMFSASLGWNAEGAIHLLANLRTVVLGLALLYGAAPVAALAASRVVGGLFPPEVAAPLSLGLMLIGAAPVAVGTVYWLAQCRGSIPLAAALITLSAALSPITMPLLVRAMTTFGQTGVHVPVGAMVGVLLSAIWLPLGAMLALRRAFPEAVERARPVISLAGTVALLGANYTVISASVATLRSLSSSILATAFAVVLGYIALNFALGWLLSGLAGLSRTDRVTLTFLTPMRLNSVALAVGFTLFGTDHPLAFVPAAIAAFQHFLAKGAHWWLVRVKRVLVREYERREIPGLKAAFRPISAGGISWPWRDAQVDAVDEEGACLVTDGPVAVDSVLELKLWMESRPHDTLTVPAVRVWNEPVMEGEAAHVGGVRFINISRGWRRDFAAFLATAERR